jgi:hypothetical protein
VYLVKQMNSGHEHVSDVLCYSCGAEHENDLPRQHALLGVMVKVNLAQCSAQAVPHIVTGGLLSLEACEHDIFPG